jgi:hypothetical protein
MYHTTEDQHDILTLLILEEMICDDLESYELVRTHMSSYPHLAQLVCKDCMPTIYKHIEQLLR